MYTTTLSTKNQITLPKFMLQMLDITSGTKFLVSEKDEIITIRPIKTSLVDELVGSMSVPKSKRGVSFEKIQAIAEYEAAKKIVENSASDE